MLSGFYWSALAAMPKALNAPVDNNTIGRPMLRGRPRCLFPSFTVRVLTSAINGRAAICLWTVGPAL